ncbi:MAG: hypothetical protein LM580_02755 [Thermofilum sp.]|jgi:hypothetical protein|nr:hypothetical protein [Thermofilum sp.]MCC6064736.1 hypothetical protein [Thermofilum sp.]
MVHVPKLLMVGRCVRCGKRLYRGDEMYRCPKCDVLYCPICYKKLHGRCQICLTQLEPA